MLNIQLHPALFAAADQQLVSLPSISSFERREWMSRRRARSWAIKPNGLIGANPKDQTLAHIKTMMNY